MNQKELMQWLSRRRESRVFDRIEEHLVHVKSCISKAIDFYDFWEKKDEKAAKNMFSLIDEEEKTADKIEAEIIQMLSKGETPEYVRADLLSFIRLADRAAGSMKRGVNNLFLLIKHDFTDSIYDILREIVRKVAEEVEIFLSVFNKMLQIEHEKLKKEVLKVDKLESEIDDLYEKMKYEIAYSSEGIPAGALIVLDHAIRDIEGASDLIEDIAEMLKSIVLL